MIPADLATLSNARPGQFLEVRHLLSDARSFSDVLASGDRIRCQDVGETGVVISTADGTNVHIPWPRARGVQVERVGTGDPLVSSRRMPVRLLTAGPVTRLLARKGGRRARSAAADAPGADARRLLARCLVGTRPESPKATRATLNVKNPIGTAS